MTTFSVRIKKINNFNILVIIKMFTNMFANAIKERSFCTFKKVVESCQ